MCYLNPHLPPAGPPTPRSAPQKLATQEAVTRGRRPPACSRSPRAGHPPLPLRSPAVQRARLCSEGCGHVFLHRVPAAEPPRLGAAVVSEERSQGGEGPLSGGFDRALLRPDDPSPVLDHLALVENVSPAAAARYLLEGHPPDLTPGHEVVILQLTAALAAGHPGYGTVLLAEWEEDVVLLGGVTWLHAILHSRKTVPLVIVRLLPAAGRASGASRSPRAQHEAR